MLMLDHEAWRARVSEHLITVGWWLLWGRFAILMLRIPARIGPVLGHGRRQDQIELRRRASDGRPVPDDTGRERQTSDERPGGLI